VAPPYGFSPDRENFQGESPCPILSGAFIAHNKTVWGTYNYDVTAGSTREYVIVAATLSLLIYVIWVNLKLYRIKPIKSYEIQMLHILTVTSLPEPLPSPSTTACSIRLCLLLSSPLFLLIVSAVL
jgi:hypothetical protein